MRMLIDSRTPVSLQARSAVVRVLAPPRTAIAFRATKTTVHFDDGHALAMILKENEYGQNSLKTLMDSVFR